MAIMIIENISSYQYKIQIETVFEYLANSDKELNKLGFTKK